jgi:hypothetical protein
MTTAASTDGSAWARKPFPVCVTNRDSPPSNRFWTRTTAIPVTSNGEPSAAAVPYSTGVRETCWYISVVTTCTPPLAPSRRGTVNCPRLSSRTTPAA